MKETARQFVVGPTLITSKGKKRGRKPISETDIRMIGKFISIQMKNSDTRYLYQAKDAAAKKFRKGNNYIENVWRKYRKISD